jgi:hypothetical protein
MERNDERKARVETVSRDINESIEEGQDERATRQSVRMSCECSNVECDQVVALDMSEYEEIRQDSRQFVVVPGHVEGDVERVVRETDRYVVVEKREGIPARIAEEEDPRT